jgi:hypothetical protein
MKGDCTVTPTGLLLEEVNGIPMTRLKPSQIKNPLPGKNYDALMLYPGDGTVTNVSLLARDALNPNVEWQKYNFFHYIICISCVKSIVHCQQIQILMIIILIYY